MNIKTRQLLEEISKSIIVLLFLCIFRNFGDFKAAFQLNFLELPIMPYVWNAFFLVVYLYFIINWLTSVLSMVQHKKMRRDLSIIAFLLVFWIITRLVKYNMIAQNSLINRYLWYLYYFPMLFAPLCGLFTVMYIGHEDSWKIPKKRYLLFLPSIVFFLFVLTNEFHHLVFIFQQEQFLIDGRYTYGWIYYCLAAWLIFLVIFMIVLVYKECRVLSIRKVIWLPVIFLILPFMWSIVKLVYNIEIFEISIIFIWSYQVLCSCLIYTGLIPSNIEHASLFDEASLSCQILDKNNEVIYSTKNEIHASKYLIEKSKVEETKLDERTIIKISPIQGGSILWLEDISSMNIMISKLRKLQEQLEDNNELLQAEINLKEKQERIDTQNQLYDQIVNELSVSIENLDLLLNDSNSDLARICFVGAYIKRMSNLIILQQTNKNISSRELNYCFKESIDVLKTNDILCSFQNHVEGNIEIEALKKVYTFFVSFVNVFYDSLSVMMLDFYEKEDYELRFLIDGNYKSIIQDKIVADVYEEDNTTYIIYHVLKGGIFV